MKRYISIVLLCLLCVSLSACAKIYNGTDELIDKAREEIPMDGRGEDIAIVQWDEGYAFIINNPKCASVKITGEAGTYEETFDSKSYPYVFYYPSLPSAYVFLDAEGNELA